jgi:gluconolactonase
MIMACVSRARKKTSPLYCKERKMSRSIERSLLTILLLALALLLPPPLQAEDDAKPVKVKAGDITLTLPASWKSSKPTSRLRLAQFTIPAVGGDKEPAELVVYFFGGSGGGVDANLQRWINQFQAKGRVVRTMEGMSKQGKYVLADVRGTYNKPIGPPVQRQTKLTPGSRMLAVVLHVEGKGNYFLKLTGSEKTITAVNKVLRTSFGASIDKEKDYKLKE